MKNSAVYHLPFIRKAKKLRSTGKTYKEINNILKTNLPKSTLSSWCRDIPLPESYDKKMGLLLKKNLEKAREKALVVNREKRVKYLKSLKLSNLKIAKKIRDKNTAKIALAILCLGEASKYSKTNRSFTLGSSDKRIILLFIKLLEYCFDDFDNNKFRCTVQCRADQNIKQLNHYWMKVTGIPKHLFYKARVDPRTIGKKTRKKDYKGVLRIDYLNIKTQLDLEILANQVFENIQKGP